MTVAIGPLGLALRRLGYARPMETGEPANAAMRMLVEGVANLNSTQEVDDLEPDPLHSEFVYEDRRTGFNFGSLDAEGWRDLLATSWAVGSGRPHYSDQRTVVMRGDRIAAVEFWIDYGDGSRFESILLVQLDESLTSWQRFVDLDSHDVDAAIALADELHALAPR